MSDKPTGTFRTDTGDELEYVDFDGHPRVLACLPPRPNFGAMPSFADHVPLVPRQEWKPISRRNWFTFILDQNGFSSCVGNGGAGGLRRARLLSGMTDVELSAAFLYSLINGGRDAGAIISDALTALLQSGTCLASQCPESQIYGPPRNSPARTEAIQTAKRFRILKAYHANSFDEAMSGLQLDYIWVGGIYVAGDFAHLDSNGIAPAHPNRYGNHCLLPDSLVSTTVPKPIRDLQPDDWVVGHDGNYHRVTETMVNPYEGRLVSIRTAANIPVRFTEGHPVLVYRPRRVQQKSIPPGTDLNTYMGGMKCHVESQVEYDDGQPKWVAAIDVRIGDYLLTPIPKCPGDVQVPDWDRSNGSAQPAAIRQPDPELAWLFGYYIADGHLWAGKAITFTTSAHQGHIAQRLAVVLGTYGIEAKIERHETYIRVHAYSTTLNRSFRTWFGDSAVSKHIPEFLYHGWDLESVVAGILDGDGTTLNHGKGVRLNTVSPVLARQVWHLFLMFGRHASIYNHRADRPGVYANAKPGYIVQYIKAPRSPHGKFWNGYYAMPVREVTSIAYVGKVYNCEVEDSHSYLADGIVSHNCVHGDGCYQSGGRWILDGVNSWGLRFGQDGRMGLVDEHFQEPGGSDSFLIQAAIEDPMDPNPPPPAKG
jgi:intein/homing endonuclease